MLEGLQNLEAAVAKRTAADEAAGQDGAKTVDVESAEPKALSGAELQQKLHASSMWAETSVAMDAASHPAQGAAPVSFASRFARSFPVQVYFVTGRLWRSYHRNVPLNVGRFMALTMLNLIFGTVYYNIRNKATTVGGVQSLVAGIFFTSAVRGLQGEVLSVMHHVVCALNADMYRASIPPRAVYCDDQHEW